MREKNTSCIHSQQEKSLIFFFQSKQMLSRETSKPLPKKLRTYVLHAVDCTLYMPKIDIKNCFLDWYHYNFRTLEKYHYNSSISKHIKKSMPKIDKKKTGLLVALF
jgi:hypothetical protein